MSTGLRARKAAATPPGRPRTPRRKEPGTGLRLPAAAGSDEDAVATERRIRLPIAGDRLFVGAVAKSFQVLELLSASGRGLTLMELAERSGLGKSATQRAAHTLRVLGYLSQHPDTRAYSLSYRMLELTHTVLAEDRVRMASLPHLEALSQLRRDCQPDPPGWHRSRLHRTLSESTFGQRRSSHRFSPPGLLHCTGTRDPVPPAG